MGLRDLPRPARLLVIGMYAVGAAALAACSVLPAPRDVTAAVVYLLLAFVVAVKRVRIHPQVASISLGFVLVFAALFRCGTLVAMAAAIIYPLACYLVHPKNEPQPSLVATGYNAASLGLAAFAAGVAYQRVLALGSWAHMPWPDLWAGVTAVFVYHGASVLAVGLISTLCRLELDAKRWWGELVSTAPVYFAGGALAFALDQAVDHAGPWVFILGLPFAYVIHHGYRAQAEKVNEALSHLRERAEASEKMARLYLSVVQALSNAIDMKDHGTLRHVRRVHSLARAVGERMGLVGNDLEAVKIGAVLHDVGKLAVPDRILRKPGRLTEPEFRLVKEHAAAGEAILRPIDFGVPVAGMIRHHHERLDGSGYPDGLCGDEIDLGTRVLAVIDVYDALVEDRPYRKAWTSKVALEHLRREAGASFDPAVVEALAEVLARGLTDQASEPAQTHEAVCLINTGVSDAIASDDMLASQGAEQARHHVLQGLVDFVADRGHLLAAVAYEPNEQNGEIDAVAVAGPCAAAFGLVRLPVGLGASGEVARLQRPAVGPVSDEFAALTGGVPDDLRGALVTALPLADSGGRTRAVLSLYGADGQSATEEAFGQAVRAAVALAAHQLESLADGGFGLPLSESSALPGMTFAESAAGG